MSKVMMAYGILSIVLFWMCIYPIFDGIRTTRFWRQYRLSIIVIMTAFCANLIYTAAFGWHLTSSSALELFLDMITGAVAILGFIGWNSAMKNYNKSKKNRRYK